MKILRFFNFWKSNKYVRIKREGKIRGLMSTWCSFQLLCSLSGMDSWIIHIHILSLLLKKLVLLARILFIENILILYILAYRQVTCKVLRSSAGEAIKLLTQECAHIRMHSPKLANWSLQKCVLTFPFWLLLGFCKGKNISIPHETVREMIPQRTENRNILLHCSSSRMHVMMMKVERTIVSNQ
jgi:hypothetical protein